nr:hypothetical protein BaRGS_015556 [Batillaria attramentaria]
MHSSVTEDVTPGLVQSTPTPLTLTVSSNFPSHRFPPLVDTLPLAVDEQEETSKGLGEPQVAREASLVDEMPVECARTPDVTPALPPSLPPMPKLERVRSLVELKDVDGLVTEEKGGEDPLPQLEPEEVPALIAVDKHVARAADRDEMSQSTLSSTTTHDSTDALDTHGRPEKKTSVSVSTHSAGDADGSGGDGFVCSLNIQYQEVLKKKPVGVDAGMDSGCVISCIEKTSPAYVIPHREEKVVVESDMDVMRNYYYGRDVSHSNGRSLVSGCSSSWTEALEKHVREEMQEVDYRKPGDWLSHQGHLPVTGILFVNAHAARQRSATPQSPAGRSRALFRSLSDEPEQEKNAEFHDVDLASLAVPELCLFEAQQVSVGAEVEVSQQEDQGGDGEGEMFEIVNERDSPLPEDAVFDEGGNFITQKDGLGYIAESELGASVELDGHRRRSSSEVRGPLDEAGGVKVTVPAEVVEVKARGGDGEPRGYMPR